MKFSIITPHLEADPFLEQCAHSVRKQKVDCEHLMMLGGQDPGLARNQMLRQVTGDWIVFLDSDDMLEEGALEHLAAAAADHPSVDLIGYNWHSSNLFFGPKTGQRKDGHFLGKTRKELLEAYLALRMDGGPTFTAVKTNRLGHLRFQSGLHEDLGWLFDCYQASHRPYFLDSPIYFKRQHATQVTAQLTKRHLSCFVDHWEDLISLHAVRSYDQGAVHAGVVAAVATRVRECARHKNVELLEYLYEILPTTWRQACQDTLLDTQYGRVAKMFIDVEGSLQVLADVLSKRWSCHDLQNSLFLGPDEIRACCKRFFVNGERRGDVVLLKESGKPNLIRHPNLLRVVQNRKTSLLDSINAGVRTDCSGCPWLEFKEWPRQERVTHLSLEYHSVCNLKCTYCDSKYYDGRRASYDVTGFLNQLLDKGAVGEWTQVVWGGGEPTVGEGFSAISQALAKVGAKQRVLTNAVKHSGTLEELLMRDAKTEVVVSVDAGTPEIYHKIRGADVMPKVLRNLRSYVFARAANVVIKYILTEDNCSVRQIKAFAAAIKKNALELAHFQVSCDFRREQAAEPQRRAIALLYAELLKINVRSVFLDDLARLRVKGWQPPPRTWLQKLGWQQDPFARPEEDVGLVIWGGGEQADRIIAGWLCGQVRYHIHRDPFNYRLPEISDGEQYRFVIAASQSYPTIHNQLKRASLGSYIERKLVL